MQAIGLLIGIVASIVGIVFLLNLPALLVAIASDRWMTGRARPTGRYLLFEEFEVVDRDDEASDEPAGDRGASVPRSAWSLRAGR